MLTHNPTTHRRKVARLLLGLALLTSQAEADWTVAMQRDPLTHQTRCLLSGTPQSTSDGYDTTPVTLVFNGDALLVITESEIDPSFGDLRLAVDENPPIRTDKLDRSMTLVFDRDVPELTQQFRKGREVTAYLRFWPAWPVTQLFPVKFSLIGFSKAHDGMNNNCQPPASATPARTG
ncbi:MAG: hypothetical protein P9E67_01720 [Candidatus Competibacter sp.]|nr:hypothetical protein [Candidatus Competibacter sp.]